ncbi:UNKNOWN [Stylonychia lemnae]|uniref:Uncharacterized protein n=1 Tax=Stylonychia lemnae TaxID=5949 RepID=A0A078B8U5_STYLE|nr:UNKNOWN [Stylonychia lemnae]|eukprot:CDW89963.1 UNKNOWN [Stylonychia lemnae]
MINCSSRLMIIIWCQLTMKMISLTQSHQHQDRLMLGNDVFSITHQFQQIQTISNSEEVSAYCNYDKKFLLTGFNNYKIGVYVFHEGNYQLCTSIRTTPPLQTYTAIVSLFKLTERLFLVILGKTKICIRVVEIDPHRWQQVEHHKIGCYSSSIVDIKRVSESKFIAQTSKKIIMFDYTVEGYDKLFRFKNDSGGNQNINGQNNCNSNYPMDNALQIPPNNNGNSRYLDPNDLANMIIFPFYDPWDLPYIIGEQLKLYDTKTKQHIGQLEGVNRELVTTLGLSIQPRYPLFIISTTFIKYSLSFSFGINCSANCSSGLIPESLARITGLIFMSNYGDRIKKHCRQSRFLANTFQVV